MRKHLTSVFAALLALVLSGCFGDGMSPNAVTVDLATQDYHPLAKKAKDTAAGAVLIAAIMAAIAGLIIFVPRLLLAVGIHIQL